MSRFMKRALQGLVLASLIMVMAIAGVLWMGRTSGAEISEAMGVPRRPVIAHRGASWWAPEETLVAYQLAMAMGVDYLEMDVQRTKDGVIVAFHDDTLDRVTNVAKVFPERTTATLDQFTLAELKQLELGSWFNATKAERARPEYVGIAIVTLDQILDEVERQGRRHGLYIETKSPQQFPGIEEALVEKLKSRGWITSDGKTVPVKTHDNKEVASVILQSFELDSLQKLKAAAPDVPRVYLVDEEMEAEAGGMEGLVKKAQGVAQALGPSGYMAWPWKTRAIHEGGLFVHHYTINTPFQLTLMEAFGSDGVFSDKSEMVRAAAGLPLADPPAVMLTRIIEENKKRPQKMVAPAQEKALDGGQVPAANRDGGPQ